MQLIADICRPSSPGRTAERRGLSRLAARPGPATGTTGDDGAGNQYFVRGSARADGCRPRPTDQQTSSPCRGVLRAFRPGGTRPGCSGDSLRAPGRDARRHYGCLTVDGLFRLPLAEQLAEDAALFLWVPSCTGSAPNYRDCFRNTVARRRSLRRSLPRSSGTSSSAARITAAIATTAAAVHCISLRSSRATVYFFMD